MATMHLLLWLATGLLPGGSHYHQSLFPPLLVEHPTPVSLSCSLRKFFHFLIVSAMCFPIALKDKQQSTIEPDFQSLVLHTCTLPIS